MRDCYQTHRHQQTQGARAVYHRLVTSATLAPLHTPATYTRADRSKAKSVLTKLESLSTLPTSYLSGLSFCE